MRIRRRLCASGASHAAVGACIISTKLIDIGTTIGSRQRESRAVSASMFFHQLIDADLGCASYVIADAGEAIVVDPGIAIDRYLDLACRHRFCIAPVVWAHTTMCQIS